MKLLSHNMLTSTCLKGVIVGYPLGINASDVKVNAMHFSPEFITKIIPKVDWAALHKTAEALGYAEKLPKELTTEWDKDEDFLKEAHHVLLEVEVIEGELICPETGRKFPITNGIPNMLLNEAEVNL